MRVTISKVGCWELLGIAWTIFYFSQYWCFQNFNFVDMLLTSFQCFISCILCWFSWQVKSCWHAFNIVVYVGLWLDQLIFIIWFTTYWSKYVLKKVLRGWYIFFFVVSWDPHEVRYVGEYFWVDKLMWFNVFLHVTFGVDLWGWCGVCNSLK